MSKLNILAICGSISSNSINGQIIAWLANHYHNKAHFEIYDGLAELPHFRPDNNDTNVPETVITLYRLIENARAILICTPEYIFSLPAALKNLMEWTVSTTLFAEKPTGYVVAATSGQMAYDQLEMILKVLGAKVRPEGKLLIPGAKAQFNSVGRPAADSLIVSFDQLVGSLLEP